MKNHFANITPLGPISVIIGIYAIAYCFRMSLVSFLLGAIGIIFGIVSLRDPQDERLKIWMSWLGIILSAIAIIGGLVSIYMRS